MQSYKKADDFFRYPQHAVGDRFCKKPKTVLIIPGKTMTATRNIMPIVLSCCIKRKYLSAGRTPDSTFEPSSGGMGRRLNIARLRLTEKNNDKNSSQYVTILFPRTIKPYIVIKESW